MKSINHIFIRKAVTFVKKKMKTNDKKYCSFRDHCHYPGKCRGAGHSICNLKYCIPK